ncbi:MAG: protein kinase [bacterium]|nr:protein kinase [bacterium]
MDGPLYILGESNGSPPFGSAWQATDAVDGRDLVVVRIPIDDTVSESDTDPLARIADDTRRLTRAHGGGLVKVLAVTTQEGRIEVVFEPPQGVSLDQWLDSAPLPSSAVISVVRSLFAAMAEAHALEVPHRALSTSDIFVNDEFEVTVAGFGLTRLAPSPAESAAPEVIAGEPSSFATDQFNLGRILTRLAEATRPILDLTAMVNRACAQQPAHRFGDLFDMASSFEEVASDYSLDITTNAQRNSSPQTKHNRWRKRTTLLATASLISVFATLGVVASLPHSSPTTETVEIDHNDHLARARQLIHEDRLAEAVPALEAALESSAGDDSASIYATLGTVRLKLGQAPFAVRDLQAAIEIDPTAEYFYTLALAQAASGDIEETNRAIDSGLRLEPDHPQLTQAREQLGGGR